MSEESIFKKNNKENSLTFPALTFPFTILCTVVWQVNAKSTNVFLTKKKYKYYEVI